MDTPKLTLESPSKEVELDLNPGYGPGSGEMRHSVPLDNVEGTRKTPSRMAQLMAVLVSGVALFSDGYNLQGKSSIYYLPHGRIADYTVTGMSISLRAESKSTDKKSDLNKTEH
jgi:hypothetical protein